MQHYRNHRNQRHRVVAVKWKINLDISESRSPLLNTTRVDSKPGLRSYQCKAPSTDLCDAQKVKQWNSEWYKHTHTHTTGQSDAPRHRSFLLTAWSGVRVGSQTIKAKAGIETTKSQYLVSEEHVTFQTKTPAFGVGIKEWSANIINNYR